MRNNVSQFGHDKTKKKVNSRRVCILESSHLFFKIIFEAVTLINVRFFISRLWPGVLWRIDAKFKNIILCLEHGDRMLLRPYPLAWQNTEYQNSEYRIWKYFNLSRISPLYINREDFVLRANV